MGYNVQMYLDKEIDKHNYNKANHSHNYVYVACRIVDYHCR